MNAGAGTVTALRALGAVPDDQLDIAEAALLMAALDRPMVDIAPYRRHLNDIIAAIAQEQAGGECMARALALSGTIAGRFDYRGDNETYDDPANADLMRVIDRRMGLPVALGILYIHAGRAQGWAVDGLDFPGHFLIRVGGEDGNLVLDPFHAGRIADPPVMNDLLRRISGERELRPEHVRPMPAREVLLRLANNIKARAWKAGDVDRAATMLERMLMVAPDFAPAWRELGLVEDKRGRIRQSIAATERFLILSGDDAAVLEAQAFLRHIRLRLN
ncbi:transglutaminase-like domain-containing protein [Ferrovibrio sp.]|uniref:SirB1 family protein n=1 Tax=Ferrovibrio sp. TaxID=1917215 RepID=UPI0025C73984|nr:transglutaminase-like domain-containing protein [Ferrovibrio sp.]MBX3454932.1 transglutaminase family protein [Ferrovibrio sp.]